MTSLGELSLHFVADVASLEASLKDVQKKALATAQSIEKAMGGLKMQPKADHRDLHELNRHIELKRTHVKDVNKWMQKNPIRVRTQTEKIDSADLDRQTKDLSARLETSVKVKATVKEGEEQRLNVSLNDGIQRGFDGAKDTIKSSFKASQPKSQTSLFGGVTNSILSPFKQAIAGTFSGIGLPLGERIGSGITKSLERRHSVDFEEIGAKTEAYASEKTARLANAALANIGVSTDQIGKDIVKFSKALDAALEPEPIGRAFKKAESLLVTTLEDAFVFKNMDRTKSEVVQEFKGLFTSVKNAVQNEAVRPYVGAAIRTAAYPFKIRRSVEATKQAQEAEKMAENIQVKDIGNAKSITLAVAGKNNVQGAGSAIIAPEIQALTGNQSHVVPVANPYTDSGLAGADYFIEEVLAKADKGFLGAINKYLTKRGVEVAKLSERLTGEKSFAEAIYKQDKSGSLLGLEQMLYTGAVQGYNPDSVSAAAHAIAYKKAYPDLPINIIGHSGGGEVAQGAAEMLSKKNISANAVGLGTPTTGLVYAGNVGKEKVNYTSIMGDSDYINWQFFDDKNMPEEAKKEYGNSPLPGMFPKSLAPITDVRRAGHLHSLPAYLGGVTAQQAMAERLEYAIPSAMTEDGQIKADVPKAYQSANPFKFIRDRELKAETPIKAIQSLTAEEISVGELKRNLRDVEIVIEHFAGMKKGTGEAKKDAEEYIAFLGNVHAAIKETLAQGQISSEELKTALDSGAQYHQPIAKIQSELSPVLEKNIEGERAAKIERAAKEAKARAEAEALAKKNATNLYRYPEAVKGAIGIAQNPNAPTRDLIESKRDIQNLIQGLQQDAAQLENVTQSQINEYINFLGSVKTNLDAVLNGEPLQQLDSVIAQADAYFNQLGKQVSQVSLTPIEMPMTELKQPELELIEAKQQKAENKKQQATPVTPPKSEPTPPKTTPKQVEQIKKLEGQAKATAESIAVASTTSASTVLEQMGVVVDSQLVEGLKNKVASIRKAISTAESSLVGDPRISRAYVDTVAKLLPDLEKQIQAGISQLSPQDRLGSEAGNQLANLKSQLTKVEAKTLATLKQITKPLEKQTQLDPRTAIKGVGNQFTEQIKSAKALVKTDPQAAKKIADGVLQMAEEARGAIDGLVEATGGARAGLPIKGAAKTARQSITRAINAAKEIRGDSASVGTDVGSGLAKGLTDSIDQVKSASQQMAEAAIDSARNTLDIRSPSRVFQQIGKFVVEGFQKGIGATVALPSFVSEFANKAQSEAGRVRANISSPITKKTAKGQAQTLASQAKSLLSDIDGQLTNAKANERVANELDALINKTEGILNTIHSQLKKEAQLRASGSGQLTDTEYESLKQEIEALSLANAKDKTKRTELGKPAAERSRLEGLQRSVEANLGNSQEILNRKVIGDEEVTRLQRARSELTRLYAAMGQPMPAKGFMSGVREQTPGLIRDITGLAKSFLGLAILSKIQQWFSALTPELINAAAAMESFERRFSFTSGGLARGASNLAFVRSEVKRLGTDLKGSMEGFVGLNAGTKETSLEGEPTKQIFSAVSQASTVYDLDAEKQSRVFAAVQQMASKGSVQAEELRGQLGESLPGAFQIAGRAMGVTTQQLSKMLEQGQVLSDDFLPKFAQQLSAETANGVAGAANSSVSAMIGFNNALFETQAALGKAFLPARNNALRIFTGLLNFAKDNATLLAEAVKFLAFAVGVVAIKNITSLITHLSKIPGVAKVAQSAMAALSMSGFAGNRQKVESIFSGIGQGAQKLKVNPLEFIGNAAKSGGTASIEAIKASISGMGKALVGLRANAVATFSAMTSGVKAFGMAAITNGLAGIMTLIGGIRALLVSLGPILLIFLAFEAAIKIWDKISFATKDAGGATRDFAKSATDGLKKYQESVNAALGKTKQLADSQKKLGFWAGLKRNLIENPLMGVASALDKAGMGGVARVFRPKDETIKRDTLKAMDDSAATGRQLITETTSAQTSQIVSDLKLIDKQLASIGIKRRATVALNPGDKSSLRSLDADQAVLLEKRGKLAQPTGILSQQLQAQTEGYKAQLEELDRLNQKWRDNEVGGIDPQVYAKRTAEVRAELEKTQLAQEAFTKSIGEAVSAFSLLQKNIKAAADELADAGDRATIATNKDKADLYNRQAAGGGRVTQGNTQFGAGALDRNDQAIRIKKLEETIQTLQGLLSTQEAEETFSAYGVDASTGQARLKTLSESAKDGSNDRFYLDSLADIKQKQIELSGVKAQLAQAQAEAQRQLEELSKSVTDYYRGIDRSTQELALTAQQQAKAIATTEAKTKLKSAVIGLQDNFVSQFIDSIIGILESLDQPFEEGIKAQQEALKNKFQYEDTYRQGTELRKQLPGADNGLTQQDIDQDLLPALRIETPNNGEAFRQITEGANQANLAITQLNTGLASNQAQLDQTSKKVTNTGTSLDNLQAKVTASASIPQTETLVEKAVGSDAQILAKQVTFDTIFAQIKAQWQDTTDVDNYWEGVSMRLGNLGMAVQVLGAGIGDMWNQSMASAGAFFDDTAARLGQAISGSDLWNKAVQGVCDTLKLPPELAQGFASVLGTKVNPAMQDVNKSIEASHPRLKQSSGLTQGIQKEARKLSGMFAYNIPVLSKIGSFMNGLINKVKEWGAWVGQVIQQFVQGIPTIGQVGDAIGNLAQGFGNSVGNMAQGLGDAVGNLAQSAGGVVNNIKGALGFGGNRSTPTQQGVGRVGGYTIHESVGSRNLPVNSFRDIHKHHPSAGIEPKRNYGTIDGEFEEIRKTRDNRTLIKKDFILSKNGRADVAVPSFAAGYAKVLNDATNTVQIYADKAMTKLLGQSLHMKNIAVRDGQEVKYGQTLGIQSNVYRGFNVGVHAHIEAELEQFKKYIQDLKDGVFEGIKGQEQAHYPGDGHNHYGEENAKKANQGMGSSGSGYRDTVVMRRTGQMDNYGLEKLLVTIYDEAGKVVKTFFANSGKPDKQNLFGGANTTPAGSNAPVEYGKYTIGAPVAGNSAAVGKTFIPTNPTFQTKRNSIGFHVDADRGVGGAGSAGCIVFATQAEFDSFRKAIATNGVNTLVFEGQTGGSQKPKVITGRQALSQAAPRTLMDSVDIFGAQVGAQASKGITAKPQRSSGGIYWGQAAKYAPSDLSGLTDRGRKAMEALKDPKVRAFLDAVAAAELGDAAAARGGYGYLFGDTGGKETFNPNAIKAHPRRRVPFGRSASSATGRYQTMDFVWDEEHGRLGLKDMKPQSQEIMAVSRLMYRGILDDIQRGEVKGALNKPGNFDASSEWASIQGNPYGQGTGGGKTSTFLTNYQKSLNQARANGVASSAPVQGSGGSTRVSAADIQGFGSLVGQAAAKPLPKLKPMANIPSSPMPSADLPDFNEFMRQNGFTDETTIRPSVPVSQPKPAARPTVKPAPKPATQPAKTTPTAAAVTQPAAKPAAPVAPPKSYLTLPPMQVKPQPALELTKQAAVVISDAQKQALANSQKATNLANQQATANSAWATLQAKIQETQAQTQKKRGLEDLEGRIASAQDQLTRDMAGLDRNEPRRQAKEAELGVLSEYRDKNRDLLRQRDEVASAVATTERSIKLFNEAIADPKSGLTDAQRELLKRQVPGLQQDLPRLKELLSKIDKVVGQQEKVRDAKLGYARETARLNEQDRTFKVAGEITEADAQKLEMRIAEIKDFQRDNPGDLSLGDPIELQGQLDLMRQALKIKQEIKALEDRERTGDLKPEEKAKLEKLKKDLNSLSTDAINRRVARETEDRSALLRNRKVEDSRASFESRRAVTEAKIKEIERTQERAPWDTSKGDAVELRRGLAIEDENLKSQENKNQLEEKRRSKRLDQEGFNRAMTEEERRHAAVIANINAEAEAEKSKRKRTEADRTFRVAAEITEADAQNLERRIAAIKDYQRDNPGDLKLGDPIELQGQLDLMRQALKIKQEIRDLENRQRNGELKPQEKARLEALKKQQNTLDVSAINRRVVREKDDRGAFLANRAIEDRRTSFDRRKAVTDNQIKAIEQYQELRPWDMSMGDPVELRRGLAVEEENLRLEQAQNTLAQQLRTNSISKQKHDTDLVLERKRHATTIANINSEADAAKAKRTATEENRTFKVAAEITEVDAQNLERKIAAIKELQRENPGDLSQGDPIELQAELDLMRQALKIKKDIKDLEDRQKSGDLKPEEKAKLTALYQQQNSLDIEAINRRRIREKGDRTAQLQSKDIEDRQSSYDRDKAVTENELKEIERYQESNPFDTSKGDPIVIRKDMALQDEQFKYEKTKNDLSELLRINKISKEKHDDDMAAEEKRHATAVANINAEADAEKTKRDSAKADFDLENKQREFENRKKAVEAEVEALSIDGRDFEAKQLQNSLTKEEQALGLEASIRALERLAETNPKVREELEQTKAELEELNQVKLDNLEEQWAKVTEERDRAIEERMVDSQSNLLEAQASALSNKGMGWDARELQKQAAVMKQELGFKQQTRNLEEFIKAQGIAGQRAEALRMQLQQLGQVQMANVQDQFSPWNDVLGSMTGGFKTFFSDVLTGSKSLKDAFTGLVDSILGSLANLAAEWLTNQIFGEIFGLGKSGKSGGDFMAGKLNGGGQPQNNIVPFSPQSATGFLPGVSLGATPMQPMYVQDVSQDFGGIADGNLLGGGQGGGNFLDSLMGGNIFGGGSVFDVGSPMPVNMVQANNDIFGSLINGFTGILGGGGGIGNLIGGVTGALGGGGGGLGSLIAPLFSFFGMNDGGIAGIDGVKTTFANYAAGGTVAENLKSAMDKERNMNGGRPVVPAVLTAGERVLTVEQNKRFEALGGTPILNFAQGGRVGQGSFAKSVGEKSGSSNSVSVNVPVNIQGGNDGSIDERKFKQILDAKVRQVITEESRQGGSLRRR